MRTSISLVLALIAAVALTSAQSPGTCAPVGTPTCGPNGTPVNPGTAPGTPATGTPGTTVPAVPNIDAVTATFALGGGRPALGAEGVALDPTTGLVYVGIQGSIISGCEGDATRSPQAPQAGAGQLSIVDPSRAMEVAAVRTGQAPIWPTVHPGRGVVYMAGSGGAGTMTIHDAADGRIVGTIVVGGKPHQGGLDLTTGLMLVGNTVRASEVLAEQNHATIVDVNTGGIVREFETSPAPHGVVVDQERHVAYFSAVGDGSITAVSMTTGQTLMTGVPKSRYGTDFGGNNMLTRQAATRRLFQVNSQSAARGILVVDEVTLAAEAVISFQVTPWGVWVDEPNRLLFAALPTSNAIGVVDLDTLSHVANIAVASCPYAVTVDPVRRVGMSSNQGSPTENASASVFNLCAVYDATGRIVEGCSPLR